MLFNSADELKKYNAVLSQSQVNRITGFILGNTDRLEFSDDEVTDLEKRLFALSKFNETLWLTASLNNEGIELEKNNNLEKAIEVYEKNISLGYPATHSFSRLIVIYRKQKRFNEEIRVLKRGIEIMKSKNPKICNMWSKRLSKSILLAASI